MNHFNTTQTHASLGFYLLLVGFFLFFSPEIKAQLGPGASETESILLRWDFDSNTGGGCSGGSVSTQPVFTQGRFYYCPNTNDGCGAGLLGSPGHANTAIFRNSICLLNFYNPDLSQDSYGGVPFDINSPSFNPNTSANLAISYVVEEGVQACLEDFSLQVQQKQFNGSTLNFRAQGVAVKRNGVLINSQTQNLSAANINATPLTFNFTGNDFCTDGSEKVTFTVIFGLVELLVSPGSFTSSVATGYDNLILRGSCYEGPLGNAALAAVDSRCDMNTGQLLLSGFDTADNLRYGFNAGSTYTGALTYATASPVPADGVLANNLPNPSSPQDYTVRIFLSDGSSADYVSTLDPRSRSGMTAIAASATCSATGALDNGAIYIYGTVPTDRYDYSIGTSYTGSATYATASPIPSNNVLANNLPNPAAPQVYTIRVFDVYGCATDVQVTLEANDCPSPCPQPTDMSFNLSPATCSGSDTNNDASIVVSNVVSGDRVELSTTGDGFDYNSAQTLVGGSFTFANLPNPVGGQTYTIRIYNGATCFVDRSVFLREVPCGPCSSGIFEVIAVDQGDIDSSPDNGDAAEDDLSVYSSCSEEIDLRINKTTSTTTATIGSTFDFALTLLNEGTAEATNIQVTDLIPDGLEVVNAVPSNGFFGTNSGWIISSLNAGASATLTITVRVLKEGMYTNCAFVNAVDQQSDADSTPGNDETAMEDDDDCADLVTVTGDNPPEINKYFTSENVNTNTPFRLVLQLTNNNSTPITLTADFVDNLPATPAQMSIAATPNIISDIDGVVALAGGTSITVPNGTILPPGLTQIYVDVEVPSDGAYCNTIAAGDLQTTAGSNLVGVDDGEACVRANSSFCVSPIVDVTLANELEENVPQNLRLTITNRGTTNMTIDQDAVIEFPTNVVIATTGTNTGNLAGVSFTAGDTELVIPMGTVIPPGRSVVVAPIVWIGGATESVLVPSNAFIVTVEGCSFTGVSNEGPAIALRSAPVAVGNLVFLDANNNGIFDGTDTGIDGVTVELYNATQTPGVDTPEGTTTTAGGGFYLFDEIPSGNYIIYIPSAAFAAAAPLENMLSSTPEGIDDSNDDDTDENGQNTPLNGGIASTPIDLTSDLEPTNETGAGSYTGVLTDASVNLTIDFGFFAPVSLGDTTWVDLDQNGLQDPTEPPLEGVKVTLFAADGSPITTDAEGNPLPVPLASGLMPGMTLTDADGFYSFDNLFPGDYYVVFDKDNGTVVNPAFYAFTTRDTGADDEADSDADPATGATQPTGFLFSNERDASLDAGFMCDINVEAGMDEAVCSTSLVDLLGNGSSFGPSGISGFGATWTSSGTGEFLDASGGLLAPPYRHGTAVSYRPSAADALNGTVIFTLTTDDPASFGSTCPPLSDQVTITVLKVDCGAFPWGG